jgi:hypothetical protein
MYTRFVMWALPMAACLPPAWLLLPRASSRQVVVKLAAVLGTALFSASWHAPVLLFFILWIHIDEFLEPARLMVSLATLAAGVLGCELPWYDWAMCASIPLYASSSAATKW